MKKLMLQQIDSINCWSLLLNFLGIFILIYLIIVLFVGEQP